MLLELQQRMDEKLAQKDNELVEKDVAYQILLERYNLKVPTNTVKNQRECLVLMKCLMK